MQLKPVTGLFLPFKVYAWRLSIAVYGCLRVLDILLKLRNKNKRQAQSALASYHVN